MTPGPADGGPGAVPLAAPPARIRPGRIWYLVAVLVILGGVGWLTFAVLSIGSHINSFPRVAVPEGGQVSLDHSGAYVIYYEGPGADSAGRIPAFQVRVIPASPSAAARSLTPFPHALTYSIGSHQGRAVLTLQVSRPGRFTVETSGADSVPAGSDLAFGDSFVGRLVSTLAPGVLLTLAGCLGLVVIFTIRAVTASRARSAAPAWLPPAAPSGPPPDALPDAPPGPPSDALPAAPPGPPSDAPPDAPPGPPSDASPVAPPGAPAGPQP